MRRILPTVADAEVVGQDGDDVLVPVIGRRLTRQQRELLREGTTMALYVSLSQLAVLLALPNSTAEDTGRAGLAVIVFMTSIGLVIAHQIAFRISSRLIEHDRHLAHIPHVMRAQLIGGGVTTALAIAPLLLFGPDTLWLSSLLLTAFVCWVAYLAARSVPVSQGRAIAYTLGILAAIIGLTTLKLLVLH